MNLSPRERRLILVLGVVMLALVAYFTLLRGGGASEDVLPDLLPTTAPPSAVSPSPVPSTFVVPVGARDPFKA